MVIDYDAHTQRASAEATIWTYEQSDDARKGFSYGIQKTDTQSYSSRPMRHYRFLTFGALGQPSLPTSD